jgi:hypothetical protein
MPDETLSIFEEQATKLPSSVVAFLGSSGWEMRLEELARTHRLNPGQARDFNTEAMLVLVGIVHPDAFSSTLVQHAKIPEVLANSLAQGFEQNILAPIRPALLGFFVKERIDAETRGELPEEGEVVSAENPTLDGTAPTNLPTGAKPEPFLPPLANKVMSQKSAEPEIILTHPFEEKMQRTPVSAPAPASTPMPSAFTTAEPIVPQVPQSTPPVPQEALSFTSTPNGSPRGTLTHDPYREPVE